MAGFWWDNYSKSAKLRTVKFSRLWTDSLGNVEGKLLWSLLAQRFFQHLVSKNNLIDTMFEEGSIQNMAGCWEHTSMVWAALKGACSKGRSLSIIWLDLANAYGPVLHVLILFALRRYKDVKDWITLMIKYCNGPSASGVTSDWYQYEKTDICWMYCIIDLVLCGI